MYDKNDYAKISRFYKILKGDCSFDFYGIELENQSITLDKIQILDKIQQLFANYFVIHHILNQQIMEHYVNVLSKRDNRFYAINTKGKYRMNNFST